jgi:hypothetical protein
MCVVDAASFDHQEEALLVARQDLDRLHCHLGERGLTSGVLETVSLVLHVRALEQA